MPNWNATKQAEPKKADGFGEKSIATAQGYKEKITLWLIKSPVAALVLSTIELYVVFSLLFALIYAVRGEWIVDKFPFFVINGCVFLAVVVIYRKPLWAWVRGNFRWWWLLLLFLPSPFGYWVISGVALYYFAVTCNAKK